MNPSFINRSPGVRQTMLSEELRTRQQTLLRVNRELKAQFVGIDKVIDQFTNAVRSWYLMPDLLTRPVIVNLWGLTGSGKTALVRSFVRLINMSDSFLEIQADVRRNAYSNSLEHLFSVFGMGSDRPSIFLFDEIQKFRTLDELGHELDRNRSLQDLWLLLSDGQFQCSVSKKEDILTYLNLYDRENIGKTTLKEIRAIKTLLKYKGPEKDIEDWSDEEKSSRLQAALKDDSTFEGDKYPQMLVILAGNIDEAYDMAKNVEDADQDADLLHKLSLDINVVHIKRALGRLFKPEQVSRFGNTHIIYPALDRKSFRKVIDQSLNSTVQRVQDLQGIELVLDPSVPSTIYENGVFPAQGVRPVLSTIHNIFESPLPTLLLAALEREATTLHVAYDGHYLVGTLGTEKVSCRVELSVQNIKKNKNLNERVHYSIHEAGHILAYAYLFKVAPSQMTSSTSGAAKGFIGIHKQVATVRSLKHLITVFLAGSAAEEIFFGVEQRSIGASMDLKEATRMAADYIRRYGFDGYHSVVVSPSDMGASHCHTGIDETNARVEAMIEEGKTSALELIHQHKSLFRDIAQPMIDRGSLEPKELVEIFKLHGMTIEETPKEGLLVPDFQKLWEANWT